MFAHYSHPRHFLLIVRCLEPPFVGVGQGISIFKAIFQDNVQTSSESKALDILPLFYFRIDLLFLPPPTCEVS